MSDDPKKTVTQPSMTDDPKKTITQPSMSAADPMRAISMQESAFRQARYPAMGL